MSPEVALSQYEGYEGRKTWCPFQANHKGAKIDATTK